MAGGQHVVVGMSGLPVRGGMGLRPALVCDPHTGTCHIPQRSATVSRDDVRRLERDGYVVSWLGSTRWSAIDGGVILYVHGDFVDPSDGTHFAPDGDLGTFLCGDKLLFVSYQTRVEALATMRRWAERLITDAQRSLASSRTDGMAARRALRSAIRARYCALREIDITLRLDAYALVAASRQLLGQAPEAVFRDAELDFDEKQMIALRSRALALALEAERSRTPHRHRLVDRSMLSVGATLPRIVEE